MKMKRLKNIKIVRGIIIMWIISLFTAIIIGVIGYINTSKMDGIINNTNENIMPKLKDWGDVNGDLGILRNSLTKVIDRPFDEKNEKDILDMNKKITEIINKNIKITENDKEENKLVVQMKNAYEKYYSYIPWTIEARKANEIPDKKITNDLMAGYGNDLSKKNVELVNYQKEMANKENQKSKSLYHSSLILFAVVFGVSILIFTIISVAVIYIIKDSIKEFMEKLEIISSGNLLVKCNDGLTNEFGIMYDALDKTIASVSDALNEIKKDSDKVNNNILSLEDVSKQMHSSIKEVSSSIGEVSNGSNDQAKSLVNINGTLNSFGNTLDDIEKSVSKINGDTKSISEKVENSHSTLNNIVSSMDKISDSYGDTKSKVTNLTNSVKQITEITNLINDIADQTSLLSLNAAIEAAKAGSAGSGFAVVADEIKKLAEQSKDSSKSISDLLSVIYNEVTLVSNTTNSANYEVLKQKDVIKDSINLFKNIINEIQQLLPKIDKTNKSIVQVNKDKSKIIDNVESISAVSEENSAASQQISASSDEMETLSGKVSESTVLLKDKIQHMIEQIEKFKI